MKITKLGLFRLIKEKLNPNDYDCYDSKLVKDVFNLVFKTIVEEVRKGNEVNIPGFGKFYPKKVVKLNAYNPVKKEFIGRVETTVFKFKPSNKIKHI